MADMNMNAEQQVIMPNHMPATIKYNESVRQKLSPLKHDMDFVRREENKLYELIDSLSQEEIAKLEDTLTLVPLQPNSNTTQNPAAGNSNGGMANVSQN